MHLSIFLELPKRSWSKYFWYLLVVFTTMLPQLDKE